MTRLRGRVIASSLIGFVLLWGVVSVQMATGNDPVLANKQATASASAADKRPRAQARELPDEEGSTDAEETEPAQAATQAIESTDPEELEAVRAAEVEAAESVEVAEAELLEAEAEPEPVTTSQS